MNNYHNKANQGSEWTCRANKREREREKGWGGGGERARASERESEKERDPGTESKSLFTSTLLRDFEPPP